MKMLRIASLTLMATACCAALAVAATKPADAPNPDASNPAYMWDLSDIYPSADAWTAEA